MKLNNHGWGTKEFIFSIVAIFLLLFVIVINVHRLYDSMDVDVENNNSEVIDNKTNNNTSQNNDNTIEEETEEIVYDENYYKSYQNKMIDATRNYIIYNSPDIPADGLRIDLTTLIDKNYINSLKDLIDNSVCGGYSIVSINSDTNLNIKTYLKCSNYETEGF